MIDTDHGGSPPQPNPLLIQLADEVLQVARKLQAHPLQNPDIVPLTPLETLVLVHVHRHPGVSPSDLAHELALRMSNASTALRGLIEKGQVERKSDPSDGRAACLHLTPAAEQAVAFTHRQWHELLTQIDIAEHDIHATVRTLTTINTTLAEL